VKEYYKGKSKEHNQENAIKNTGAVEQYIYKMLTVFF
jgi:hypothetical protein